MYSSWRAPWAPEAWSHGPEPDVPEMEGGCLAFKAFKDGIIHFDFDLCFPESEAKRSMRRVPQHPSTFTVALALASQWH